LVPSSVSSDAASASSPEAPPNEAATLDPVRLARATQIPNESRGRGNRKDDTTRRALAGPSPPGQISRPGARTPRKTPLCLASPPE
jgi:hypothetical protein